MSQSYRELRDRARSLALATLFDKATARDRSCDLLQLGLELEKIIEIASEPMLAMIRMQYWSDLFENTSMPPETAAFVKRLAEDTGLPNSDILEIIQQTQTSLQSPTPSVAWDVIFTVMAKANHWQIDTPILTQLGRNIGALYNADNSAQFVALQDAQITKASHGTYGFPRLVNLLINRQFSGKKTHDYLLVFRYLWRVLR